MGILPTRRFTGAALLCFALSACGGGSAPKAGAPPVPAQQHARTAQSTSGYDVDLGGGYSGHLSLGFGTNKLGLNGGPQNTGNCPEIPEIQLVNNSANSFAVGLSTFTITVPCVVPATTALEATFFVLQPIPNNVVAGQKLAMSSNVQPNTPIAGSTTITFTPATGQTTFSVPAKSVSGIVALQVSSDPTIAAAQVALPVIPNVTTDVTSSQHGLGTDKLLFSYATSTGNPFYQAACFPGAPSPALAPVGRPKFYCNLDTAGTLDTVFAGTPGTPNTNSNVSFKETVPLDASVLGLDGTLKTFSCQTSTVDSTTQTQTATCASSQFTINHTGGTSFYSNIIASNVNDIKVCTPASAGTDCNAGAASATVIKRPNGDFQLLVADDPTYHPVVGQWTGLLTATIAGDGCVFSTSPTLPLPPPTSTVSYNAAAPAPTGGYAGAGPYVAFEFTPVKNSDSCTISVSEDKAYIQDANTGNGRTAAFTPPLK